MKTVLFSLLMLVSTLALAAPQYVDSAVVGMVGDDATDNSVAFQKALALAQEHASKTLLIRGRSKARLGIYRFGTTIVIPPNITLLGEGNPGDMGGYDQWGVEPSVRLVWTGTGHETALYLPQCSSNRIENVCLDGNVNALGTGLCVANQSYHNAKTTQGSTQLTITRRGGLPIKPGDIVRALSGIPENTTVVAVNGDTITMSQAATETREHKGPYLFISDGDYPGGYYYGGFAGNHLALEGVMIRDFGVNFFSHYLGGCRAMDCNFGNAKNVNVWIENAIHFDWSQIWAGGRQLNNPVEDALCYRFVGNQSGFALRGGEMYLARKAAEIESGVATFENVNLEWIGEGPYFDVTGSGRVVVRESRFAPSAYFLNAIPVRCHHGSTTVDGCGIVGAPHTVLVQTCSGLSNVVTIHCGGWHIQEIAGVDDFTVVNTVPASLTSGPIVRTIPVPVNPKRWKRPPASLSR